MTRKTATIEKRFSRWIRLYVESLNDPKVLKLSDHEYRKWVQMLLVAGMHLDGNLPGPGDMALHWRCGSTDGQAIWERFIEIGLIDLCGGNPGYPLAYRPHNWDMRQYHMATSTERVRKHRRKKAQSTGVTFQKRFSETQTKRKCNNSSESVLTSCNTNAAPSVTRRKVDPSKKRVKKAVPQ